MHRARLAALSALVCWAGRALAAPPAPPHAPLDSATPATPTNASPVAPSATEARLAEARRLGSRGLMAYDQGDYDAAIDSLTRAIEFHDAPALRLYRARAFGRLGLWAAACKDFDAVVRAPVVVGETAVAAQARAAAGAEGKEACARIADAPVASLPAHDSALVDMPEPTPPATATLDERQRTVPSLQLDVSFFGSVYNRATFTRPAFDSYEGDSSSVASRVALSWYPQHETVLDGFGLGLSWVQDHGTGRFNYSEALAAVMFQYFAGRWRLGAQLGGGYLHSGIDVLEQRYVVTKPSVEAGVHFGNFEANAVAAAFLPMAEVGPSLYADFWGYGMEGRLVLDYRLWSWLGVEVAATLSRLEFDLDAPTRDTRLADGLVPPSVSLVDRYTSVFLSLTVNL